MKPFLILCIAILICFAACKKTKPVTPVDYKLQAHLDSVNAAFTKIWHFNLIDIQLGVNYSVTTTQAYPTYDLTFDGKSVVSALPSYIAPGLHPAPIIANYKISSENGKDYITFSDSSNNFIDKAQIVFPGNNSLNVKYAQQMYLYMNKGEFCPVLSDPTMEQDYSGIPKIVEYYRQN